jgi:hypothetical protein
MADTTTIKGSFAWDEIMSATFFMRSEFLSEAPPNLKIFILFALFQTIADYICEPKISGMFRLNYKSQI